MPTMVSSRRLVLFTALAALIACGGRRSSEPSGRPAFTSADLPDDPGARVPGAIVVDFQDGTTQQAIDTWEKEWAVDLQFNSVEGPRDGVAIAVAIDEPRIEEVLERIRRHPSVEAAEPLMELRASYVPNDPDYGRQWNFQLIDMPKAWDSSRGRGVVVAVLDTGIAYEDHGEFIQVPDLKGVKFVSGYDFVNDDEHANDDHGHGTHVAGTIAQATNNREGVAGVAFEASLMAVKVLNHFGSGTSADIADAIRWAADNGAKVLNLSLGGGGRSQVMERAVEYARKKGAVVVCAAGNSGQGRVEFPAAYPGAVAVGAVGSDGTRAPYSSFGKELDLAAPGGDKRRGEEGGVLQNTIDPRDPARSIYASLEGTSMATPHVAAVAALLFSAGARGPDDVERALFAGARAARGQSRWSEEYGHGILNAQASLAAVGSGRGRWMPLVWAAVLLALVLLSLRRKERPGYLNVLVRPAFFLPLILATVGLFFIQWLWSGTPAAAVLDAAALPIPDWDRLLFGRGKLANPLFYSALLPMIFSLAAVKLTGLRPTMGGLAIGFAAFLGYAAWAKAPALAYLPFTFLAVPWLVVNALVCLVIARAMLRQERMR